MQNWFANFPLSILPLSANFGPYYKRELGCPMGLPGAAHKEVIGGGLKPIIEAPKETPRILA